MNKFLQKFSFKNEFVKNTLTLTTGASIAQLIPIIFYPVLSRIFLASEFGLLATVTSITVMISVIATGRYENCILITKSKQEAANVIGLIIILSLTILLICSLFLIIFLDDLSNWLNEVRLNQWIFVAPISAFAIIIYNIYNEWCVRNKYFKHLSFNKVTNTSTITFGNLGFGLAKVLNGGLVLGDTLGRVITASFCIIRSIKNDGKEFKKISLADIKYVSKRYIDFPKFILPGQLLNTIGGQLPVILIAVYFNSMEVGYFSMTMNILLVPASIISLAVRDVFRQKATEEFQSGINLHINYKKLLKLLLVVSIIGVLLIIGFLPFLFSFILGNQWRIAGEYAQILSPMIALSFISNSLSGILIVKEKLKVIFSFHLYYFASTLAAFLIGGLYFKDIRITLVWFAILRSSAYILEIYLSYSYSKRN